jgi:hypothetical protein
VLGSTASMGPISCSSLSGLLGKTLSMRAESNSRQIRCALRAGVPAPAAVDVDVSINGNGVINPE